MGDPIYSSGDYVVRTGTDNDGVYVFSTDGTRLHSFEGHDCCVCEVVFSPDGRCMASGSRDGTVRIWSLKSGLCLRIIEVPSDHVYSVAFSPDGSKVVSGADDGDIHVWSVKTGELLRHLKGHCKLVRSVVFSPDGTMLASGADDKTVRVWSVENGSLEQTMEGHPNDVGSVAFSHDGQKVVSTSHTIACVWSVKDGTRLGFKGKGRHYAIVDAKWVPGSSNQVMNVFGSGETETWSVDEAAEKA